MARYVLIAMNGPTPGKGDEAIYNDWYNGVHVPDLLATPGIVSARRFRTISGTADQAYVAIYEIETDDLAATMAHMGEHNRPFDPTFDRSKSGHILAVEIDAGQPRD